MSGIENDVLVIKNVNFDYLSNPPHTGIVTADGQLLIGSTANPNIAMVANTLTPGTGITITNGPGTITIASTASSTDLHTAIYIVSSAGTSGTGANYTTITAAIAAAQGSGIPSTIFIQPGTNGTYTENFTLPANINLVAYTADALTPNVTIIGKITCTDAGTRSISGIRLQTNSDFFLAVTGSAASIVNLNNCYLNCSNNTGISYTSSSSSSAVNILNCQGNLGTTGIGLFSSSSAGTLVIYYSRITNSGGSTTASTMSAGVFGCFFSELIIPITTSGTNRIGSLANNYNTSTLNTTAFTVGGSGTNISQGDYFSSGTASGLSVGGALKISAGAVDSTNANAVTGAGTLNYTGFFFPNSSNTINTTTVNRVVFDGGEYKGRNVNTAPSAGMIGEQITSSIGTGAGVSLTTATAKTVTSISLTAGIWDVSALGVLNGTLTGTRFLVSISATDNTLGTGGVGIDTWDTPTVSTAAAGMSGVVPALRVTLNSTTTYYLVCSATFTVGTATASGRISAKRVA